jgi:hypothetical protein
MVMWTGGWTELIDRVEFFVIVSFAVNKGFIRMLEIRAPRVINAFMTVNINKG